jgi:hypothetical protein
VEVVQVFQVSMGYQAWAEALVQESRMLVW